MGVAVLLRELLVVAGKRDDVGEERRQRDHEGRELEGLVEAVGVVAWQRAMSAGQADEACEHGTEHDQRRRALPLRRVGARVEQDGAELRVSVEERRDRRLATRGACEEGESGTGNRSAQLPVAVREHVHDLGVVRVHVLEATGECARRRSRRRRRRRRRTAGKRFDAFLERTRRRCISRGVMVVSGCGGALRSKVTRSSPSASSASWTSLVSMRRVSCSESSSSGESRAGAFCAKSSRSFSAFSLRALVVVGAIIASCLMKSCTTRVSRAERPADKTETCEAGGDRLDRFLLAAGAAEVNAGQVGTDHVAQSAQFRGGVALQDVPAVDGLGKILKTRRT